MHRKSIRKQSYCAGYEPVTLSDHTRWLGHPSLRCAYILRPHGSLFCMNQEKSRQGHFIIYRMLNHIISCLLTFFHTLIRIHTHDPYRLASKADLSQLVIRFGVLTAGIATGFLHVFRKVNNSKSQTTSVPDLRSGQENACRPVWIHETPETTIGAI